jgi:hypothetical protein
VQIIVHNLKLHSIIIYSGIELYNNSKPLRKNIDRFIEIIVYIFDINHKNYDMKTITIFSLSLVCILGITSIGYGQYNPDRHNTSYNAGWISCEASDSPNPARGNSHWIMYDFGDLYKLGKIHLWNTNIPGNESVGIKDYLIEYSADGTVWQSWGESSANMASASGYYLGEEGPDLAGIETRFLLITALSNHGGDCVGFSEIRFQTEGLSTDVQEIEELAGLVTAQPSVFSDLTTIILEDIEPDNYLYRLTDLSGKVVLQSNINIFQKKEQVEIQGNALVQGVYIFTITNGSKLKSIKIEKINP